MFINPFSPLTFLKVTSLKATSFLLLGLLIKSNLLRLKGGLIGGLFALILLSGLIISSSVAVGSLIYIIKSKSNESKNGDTFEVDDKFEAVSV